MLCDAERQTRSDVPLMEFARRVSVMPAADLDAHLPGNWAARVVVNSAGAPLEETVIAAPFDSNAPGLAQGLSGKWRRLLRAEDARDFFADAAEASADNGRAVLWQMIERRVSMAAQPRRKAAPAQG
jgi:hypothetical protein